MRKASRNALVTLLILGQAGWAQRPIAPPLEPTAAEEVTRPAAALPKPRRLQVLPEAAPSPAPAVLLGKPIVSEANAPRGLVEAPLAPTDQPLPINLATALKLSDARPLIIAAAQARVQIAAARLEKAEVLWLPTVNVGANNLYHAGGIQNTEGKLVTLGSSSFLAGGSLEMRFATTDAIFEPLAARQELRARQIDLQTAKNEALLATAEAYFTVQQARGTYAAMLDLVDKGRELVRRVEALARGLAAPDEIERARTLLAELEQAAATAQQHWRVAGARLTRVLRLNPAAVVLPLEPDHLQVTLVSPKLSLDELIPIGLMNRPELASHQALVQATLERLRQERMRPLIPSLLITGNGTPDFFYQGGIFGTGQGASINQWAGRADVNAQLVWRLENLGFGNASRVRERRGQMQLANVELFETQDRVAAEVTQAMAELESAAVRVGQAEKGLKEGLETFAGNLKGMGQTTRFGDVLSLVNRPQEVTAALQQLQNAYLNFYRTTADYNRAQFRVFYALGFPAEFIACQRPVGETHPVDESRPGYLPPVCAPAACPPSR